MIDFKWSVPYQNETCWVTCYCHSAHEFTAPWTLPWQLIEAARAGSVLLSL
jgi:hypothetical protein